METYVPPLTTAVKAFNALSPKQLVALEALLAGTTRCEAARAAGVDDRTLRRWQHDPSFRMALQQARCDLWIESASLLQQANREAIQTLVEALRDESRSYTRVMAARTILDWTVKALTVDAIGSRCDQTEHDIERLLREQVGAHPEQDPSCSCSESAPPPADALGQEEPAPDTLQKPDISGHAPGAFPNRESEIRQSEIPRGPAGLRSTPVAVEEAQSGSATRPSTVHSPPSTEEGLLRGELPEH
jgi:hypothetical protein